jgi:hypothetical protein
MAYGHIDACLRFDEVQWSDIGESLILLLEMEASNQELQELLSRIILAEELIATSFGFHEHGLLPDPSPYNNDITRLEGDWVESQVGSLETVLDGLGKKFGELYPSFRKVAFLMHSAGSEHVGYGLVPLGVFLEPLRAGDDLPEVVDCLDRCEELALAVETISTYPQLVDWLEHRNNDPADRSGWHQALIASAAIGRRLPHAAWLRELTRGKLGEEIDVADAPRAVAEIEDAYRTLPGPRSGKDVRQSTLFYPKEVDGYWYVNAAVPVDWTQEYLTLVVLEGIRQQLDSGLAFQCPFRRGPECFCAARQPEFRNGLNRLAQYAKTGGLEQISRKLSTPCSF